MLAVVLVLVVLPSTLAAAQDARLEDQLSGVGDARTEAEQELGEVRAAEGDARVRLEAATGQVESAEADLEELEAALRQAQDDLDEATANAATARQRLEEVNAELAEAEDELDEKSEQLDARVRAAFKYGQVSFLEAFVGTKDITEFLNSGTYVASVLDSDKALVEEVSALLGLVEEQRASAQALRVEAEREAAAAVVATAEVERATEEQERLTALVRERREDRERALEELADDRAAIEEHLAGLEAESQRIQDQLAAIAQQQAEEEARRLAEEEARRQAEEQARLEEEARQRAEEAGEPTQSASAPDACADEDPAACEDVPGDTGGDDVPAPPPPSDGSWTRPVGGPLTSPFGPRWGRNHNGVDIGASVGTGVAAARGGTVVHVTSSCHPTSSFGCGGGFGNYVTVAHAGGLATVYAHLSSVSVGVGQYVEQGAGVGAIGNSGNSYGPHLHFEVREGGAARNPCGYISC